MQENLRRVDFLSLEKPYDFHRGEHSALFFFISDVMSFHERLPIGYFPFVSIAILYNFHDDKAACWTLHDSSQFCSVSQFVRSRSVKSRIAEIMFKFEKEKKKLL